MLRVLKKGVRNRELHLGDLVLTVGSMCLSGYFGYSIAEGVYPLNWVLAGVTCIVAFMASVLFKRAAKANVAGNAKRARHCLQAGMLCIVANIMFDFSSASALRDAVATTTSNTNVVATNREKNLKLIDDEIASIKNQNSWKTPYQAAATYEAEITNLVGSADIMKRSDNCQNQTRPDTKEHCSKIASARGHLAGVKQKQLLDARLAELTKQREAAMIASEGAQHKSNPAVAIIRMVGAVALQKDELTPKEAFWVGLGIMLFMTGLLNGLIYFIATEIGSDEEPEASMSVDYTALRVAGPAEAREPVPIPLRATDVPQRNAIDDQLTALIAGALTRYNKSEFSREGGRA